MENYNLESRVDYKQYLKQFKYTGKPIVGYLYSFNYLFTNHEKFDETKMSIKQFYDFYPISFIFDVNPKTRTFKGLNLHHLPVQSRLIWLARISRFKRGGERMMIPYELLKPMFYKATYAVRQYRMDSMRYISKIPFEKWNELSRWTPKYLYASTLEQETKLYRNFIPKHSIRK